MPTMPDALGFKEVFPIQLKSDCSGVLIEPSPFLLIRQTPKLVSSWMVLGKKGLFSVKDRPVLSTEVTVPAHLANGHVHHNRTRYAQDMRFETCTGTAFAKKLNLRPDCSTEFGFVRCAVSEDRLEPAFIPLRTISTAAGYGPGGHDPVRDYSISWEKPSYGDEQ